MSCLLSATCRGVAQEGMSKKEAQKKLEMEENDPTKFKENRTARMNRMRGTGDVCTALTSRWRGIPDRVP